jgi:hypothetical protein
MPYSARWHSFEHREYWKIEIRLGNRWRQECGAQKTATNATGRWPGSRAVSRTGGDALGLLRRFRAPGFRYRDVSAPSLERSAAEHDVDSAPWSGNRIMESSPSSAHNRHILALARHEIRKVNAGKSTDHQSVNIGENWHHAASRPLPPQAGPTGPGLRAGGFGTAGITDAVPCLHHSVFEAPTS